MQLTNLDLNLLVTLEALLTERNVTHAAEQLGRSQPAVSSALARLRRHFGDELLRRSGNSYVLTPLAAQLVEPAEVAVSSARKLFSAQPTFDPAHSRREFAVLLSDYALSVLGGPLARLTDERAPHVRLHLRSLKGTTGDLATEAMHTADAVVLPHGFVDDVPYFDLYTDDWVCLVASDNAEVGDDLTIEQLRELPWVVTYHRPTALTPATRQLRTLGVEPHVSMVVESFLALPALIPGTRRIALLQSRLADRFHDHPGLRVLPSPLRSEPLVQALWWHPMNNNDPGHRWLRELIADAAAECD